MTSLRVADPVIEVCDLTKDYGAVRAVDHVSFAVGAGTITGFLGPNGSGKSTTLRVLVGLVEATEGTARIAGRPYRELVDPLNQVGTMLEAAAHPARSARSHLRPMAVATAILVLVGAFVVEKLVGIFIGDAVAYLPYGSLTPLLRLEGSVIGALPAAIALALTTVALVAIAAALFTRRDITP